MRKQGSDFFQINTKLQPITSFKLMIFARRNLNSLNPCKWDVVFMHTNLVVV